MSEIPVFYYEKGSNLKKNPLQKGVVFNSQNYDGYPLLMALTLPDVHHLMLFIKQNCRNSLYITVLNTI